MDKYGKIRILTIVFFILILFATTYELYCCVLCLTIEDKFEIDKESESDVCVQIGKPMSIVMLLFVSLMIAAIICFLVGVYNCRWCYTIWWVSIQPSNLAILGAYISFSSAKTLPMIACATHFFLWGVGIYIHCVMSRFNKLISFA